MKVFCKINNIFELVDNQAVERLKKYIRLSDGQLNLKKNQEYCVYGILFRDNSPWYYLCVNEDDSHPTPYPAEIFNITDGGLSLHWRLVSISYPNGVIMSSLVFEEWANDASFYERLIDGDPEAIRVFQKYQTLMNNEQA